MRSCYVSTPYGTKRDALGRRIDFDQIYRDVVRPALERSGLSVSRLDEIPAGALIQRELFSTLVGSDLMIADISTHNANVMYELGLRHALRRGGTVLIAAQGVRIPFDVSNTSVILYELDESGRVSDEAARRLQEQLRAAVHVRMERFVVDSALYDFFPELKVELPAGLSAGAPRTGAPGLKGDIGRTGLPRSKKALEATLQEAEAQVRASQDVDPFEYIRLLRGYRELSSWDRLVTLADEAATSVRNSPEVRQLLALALNRRGQRGDQARAIAVIEQLIAEIGGDSESYGILGKIYKDRYEQNKIAGNEEVAAKDLDNAIRSYKAGFERQPTDYYPGVNAVTLLFHRGDPTAQGELAEMLPRVREAVRRKMESGRPDYWEFATAMELAAIAGEWEEAAQFAKSVAATAASGWMVDTSVRNLKLLKESMSDPRDQERIEEIATLLGTEEAGREGPNA